jgi:hypothetical protein
MDMLKWLARVASLVDRLRRKANRTPDPYLDRRRASRSLATKLPPHLRKDIGADDG